MAANYIVSARKYRPEVFSSIVGQEATASTLRTAVLQGRVAHAYLFCGPRGVGKTTAARVLARTLNCMSLSPEGEACGACESCRAFEEQRSFNIFELDAASNNSVEDIRSLIEQVAIPPAIGQYKVYIIDEVHMLSQAAFNAFLKTLEEPPSYAIFILATTEKHKVLPTILSRCQIYDFRRITVTDIAAHLGYVAEREGIAAEESALSLIAEKADGGMRDALSMFDRVASYSQGHITYTAALECLNVLDYTYYTRMIEAMIGGNYQALLLLLDELLAKGFDGQVIIGGLASFMRDLLVVQHPDTVRLLEKPDSIMVHYQQTAQMVAPAAIYQAIKMLVACDQQYRSATNKRLLIELALLNILATMSPAALGVQPAESVVSQPMRGVSNAAPTATQAMPSSTVRVQRAPASSAPSAPPTAPAVSPVPSTPTEPAVRPSTAPPSAMGEGIQTTRQAFRTRMSRQHQTVAQEVIPAIEETSSQAHQAFDELAMQRAWVSYVESQVPEEAIIVRRTMMQSIPVLISPTMAEIGIVDSPTLIAPVAESLPQIERYMQHQLRNSSLRLIIRPVKTESVAVPITSQERFETLVKLNPALEELRTTLNLRIK